MKTNTAKNKLRQLFWQRGRKRTSSSLGQQDHSSHPPTPGTITAQPAVRRALWPRAPCSQLYLLLPGRSTEARNKTSAPAVTCSSATPRPAPRGHHQPTVDFHLPGCSASAWSQSWDKCAAPSMLTAGGSHAHRGSQWGQGNRNQSLPGKWV